MLSGYVVLSLLDGKKKNGKNYASAHLRMQSKTRWTAAQKTILIIWKNTNVC